MVRLVMTVDERTMRVAVVAPGSPVRRVERAGESGRLWIPRGYLRAVNLADSVC
jgi:hypothetical protein